MNITQTTDPKSTEMNSVESPRLERTFRTKDLLDLQEGETSELRSGILKSTFRRIPADEMGENRCSRFCLAWFSCCFATGKSRSTEQ
jgi:hypothetical protein